MKITKYLHSCVVVETPKRTVLFDPGSFSWESGLVSVDSLPEIQDIIVTHEHADHFSEEFVKALISRFPNALWTTNESVAQKLKILGALNITTKSSEFCVVRNIPHADVVPFGVQVDHIAVDWNGLVTHPGDTLDFDTTLPVLHLPVYAPWAKTVDAMRKLIELKPKYVLPIHDWMLREEWLTVTHNRIMALCLENDIQMINSINAQPIEIEL